MFSICYLTSCVAKKISGSNFSSHKLQKNGISGFSLLGPNVSLSGSCGVINRFCLGNPLLLSIAAMRDFSASMANRSYLISEHLDSTVFVTEAQLKSTVGFSGSDLTTMSLGTEEPELPVTLGAAKFAWLRQSVIWVPESERRRRVWMRWSLRLWVRKNTQTLLKLKMLRLRSKLARHFFNMLGVLDQEQWAADDRVVSSMCTNTGENLLVPQKTLSSYVAPAVLFSEFERIVPFEPIASVDSTVQISPFVTFEDKITFFKTVGRYHATKSLFQLSRLGSAQPSVSELEQSVVVPAFDNVSKVDVQLVPVLFSAKQERFLSVGHLLKTFLRARFLGSSRRFKLLVARPFRYPSVAGRGPLAPYGWDVPWLKRKEYIQKVMQFFYKGWRAELLFKTVKNNMHVVFHTARFVSPVFRLHVMSVVDFVLLQKLYACYTILGFQIGRFGFVRNQKKTYVGADTTIKVALGVLARFGRVFSPYIIRYQSSKLLSRVHRLELLRYLERRGVTKGLFTVESAVKTPIGLVRFEKMARKRYRYHESKFVHFLDKFIVQDSSNLG